MENQNKYIQIESSKKQKEFPLENNGNFQNILKLLTEQRSKIDEMLVKTRNYQVSRQRISRGGGKEPEPVEDVNFLEDISMYQNGASQTVEELRKKIDTLKKRHKSEMNGHNLENTHQQNQIIKKKNVQTPVYKHSNSNYISPQKGRLGNTIESSKQQLNNYQKDHEQNHPLSSKSQQSNNNLLNNNLTKHNEDSNIEVTEINNFQSSIKEQRSRSIPGSQNNNQYGNYQQHSQTPEKCQLPPIQQNLNQSVDFPRRDHRSSSSQYKKYGSTFNKDALNKSDLGIQQYTEDEDIYNSTTPNEHHNIYIPTSIQNTRGARSNAYQRNGPSGMKIDNYEQRYKQNMKSKQIRKIYLQNPVPHNKASYFNYNSNISPEKREFRETFLNDMNKNIFQNNVNSQHKPKKKKKGLNSQKKASKMSILDQDIFNLHKNNQQIPSLDINPTEFTYFNNNSQVILNTSYDQQIPGNLPQGINCMNYYNDFEQLIKRQSMETLSILEYVFDTSKSKSKPELLEKLSEFKQNFTLHAEKQDKQIREIKKKYHHFRKFDLPKDFDLGNQTI
ncbi:hypothetical protein ABPG72_008339 [Tetrahymena utriculariae]